VTPRNQAHDEDTGTVVPARLLRLGIAGTLLVMGLAFLAVGLGGAITATSGFGDVSGDASQILVLTFYTLLSLGAIGLGFTLAGTIRSARDGPSPQLKTLLGLWTALWIVLGLVLVFGAQDTVGIDISDGILTALAGLFALIAVLVHRDALEVKIASSVLALTGVILLMIADGTMFNQLFVGFSPWGIMDAGVFYAAYLIAIPAAVLYARDHELRAASGRLLGGVAVAVAGIGGLVEGVTWLDSSPWDRIGAAMDTGLEVGAWFQFGGGIAFFVASVLALVVSVLTVVENVPSTLRLARTEMGAADAGGGHDGGQHQGGGQPAKGPEQGAAGGRPEGGSRASQPQGQAATAAPSQGNGGAGSVPSQGPQEAGDEDAEPPQTETVFCPGCGEELRPQVAFCPQCGDEVPG